MMNEVMNAMDNKTKRNRLGENTRKIMVRKIILPGKKKKVLMLIDIGLIFLFVGLALWALVCLGIIGRPEDLFTYSNMYANIGTLLFGFGVILSGIGIAIENFSQLISKNKFRLSFKKGKKAKSI
jgi:uncharacterized membrane protein